jgi:two-component system, chemotaxis family, sensor kinase CheA
MNDLINHEISLLEKLEELSESLIFTDITDLQSLAGLHTKFEDIGKISPTEKLIDFLKSSKAATKLIEMIILDEVKNPNESIDVLNRTVASMQALVRDKRPPSEVKFPDELFALTGNLPTSVKDINQKKPDVEKGQIKLSDSETEANSKEQTAKTTFIEADMGLLADFVVEANEHLQSADVNLLTLETTPEDEEAINAVFRAFHTIKGVAGFLGLEQIGSLAHEAENLLDKARKGELVLEGFAIDITFDAVDSLKRLIMNLNDSITTGNPLKIDGNLHLLINQIREAALKRQPDGIVNIESGTAVNEKLGEILVKSGNISKDDLESTLEEQESSELPQKLGEMLIQKGQVQPKEIAHALRSQKISVKVKEGIKVDADRLDRLVDMIGELVIAESMVVQSKELKDIASSDLARHMNQLDKITRELQEMGTSLRMVPVKSTFQKMARLVRDLAKKSGKKVDLILSGEDTELDKTVVDKINDPLVHMIRNAVDHGIESNIDDRKKAGKPPNGSIHLRAFHKGGNIYIEVEDDGKGLDKEVILEKAKERKLIRPGENLSDRQIYNMIFQPGFSTAKVITDVSGRGVGMDVVKRNIDDLRGQVDIQTELGKGSTFSIRLPLTLAIIDGMVIGVGSDRYVIPTLSIVMSIRPETKDLSTVLGKGEMIRIQDKLIPIFRLSRLFKITDAQSDPTKALIVVVEDEGKRAGILVDRLMGQQQIVIKSLGDSMSITSGISGGAIMPDGRVGLILDVGGLVMLANDEDNSKA